MPSQGVTNAANAIINKINNLISSHNSNGNAHQDIRASIPSAEDNYAPKEDGAGSSGSASTWSRSDHTHPKSSIYAEASHTHNTTEIRDSSAYNRIGSDVNDTQAEINDSIDLALTILDDNIVRAKMDLVGFDEFQVKDFINPNNWENAGCTYSDGVLTFLGSNSFTATFPTDSLVGELGDFELSFDYIIDDGLILGDTIDFDTFGREINYTVVEDDINDGYAIIDVSFKSKNNHGIITSEASGDEWHIDDVGSLNPYTIRAITPVGNSTKIANIRYKANNIISLNDNKENVYNKVTSLSSSSTDSQYPSAKAVYDVIENTFNLDTLDCINENFTLLSLPQIIITYNGNSFHGGEAKLLNNYSKGAYVSWDDGTPLETYESTDTLEHSYSDNVQEHTITIYGNIPDLYNNSFKNLTGITNINIPSSVTSLGSLCFNGCTGLTSITIPSSVIGLGGLCFRNCTNLVDYQLYWERPPVIWNSNLMPNNTDTYFTIPNGTTANYTAKNFPSDKLVERSE